MTYSKKLASRKYIDEQIKNVETLLETDLEIDADRIITHPHELTLTEKRSNKLMARRTVITSLKPTFLEKKLICRRLPN